MTTTFVASFRTEALSTLGQHGILTTAQLHTIVTHRTGRSLCVGSCRRSLAKAEKAGLVTSVSRTRGPEKSWYLTSGGFEAVAGTISNPLKMNAAIATGPTAAHLGVVNALGVRVTEALGLAAEVSWTHEQPLPLGSGRYLRPDAVLNVLTQQGGELVGGQWFVEADRGTESTGTLVDKLVNYLTYRNYRPTAPGDRTKAELHWRTRFRDWPDIMFAFDCPRAEKRIQRFSAWAGNDPRLEPHWGKLNVAAIASVVDVDPTKPLLQIPTLSRKPWLA